jgi:lipopolysaccharide export system protein LptA
MKRFLIAALLAAAAGPLAVAETAPPPAARAPGSDSLFTGNSPIDVSSASQERVGPDHLILRGEVEVIQGQARLRSPQIDLYTRPRGQAPGEHAATPGGSLGAVERATAEGPVYYVTPTQTAKGDHGLYVAADDSITLTGNVILTQGQNVSTGDKLVIHQKTSQAVLTGGGPRGGRTRAVIYPNQPAPGAPAGAAKPAPKP